jgi:hemoglobin
LHLWTTTVDELFAGERAELAKAHAIRVAAAFESRLRSFDQSDHELSPGISSNELPVLQHHRSARA